MSAFRPGSVTLAELRAVWAGAPVKLHADAWEAIDASAASIARILASGRTVYVGNTGCGILAQTRIPRGRLAWPKRAVLDGALSSTVQHRLFVQ